MNQPFSEQARVDVPSSDHRSLKYRADIDGLRGLAVLLVVLFHADFGVPGGFIGVDVFFVISGYLITSLITRDVEQNRFRLRDFWVRRICRILPASLAMTLTVLVAGCVLLIPSDLDQLATAAFAHQCFAANLYFYFVSDYFAGPAEQMPLLHTWSLSVEEQFYLIFPLVLPLLVSRRRSYALAGVLLTAVGSFVACVVWTDRDPAAAFYLIPTRAWELAVGAAVALLRIPQASKTIGEILTLAGIAGILYSAFSFNSLTPFPGYNAVLPVGCACLIVFVDIAPQLRSSRLLCFKPLQFTGRISYSLYLWHWPMFAFGKYVLGDMNLPTRLAIVAFSFIVSIASWKWIETPLRRPVGVRTSRIFLRAPLAVAMVASIAFWIAKTNGLPSRMNQATQLAIADTQIHHQHLAVELPAIANHRLPIIGDESRAPKFLLWGDSHALAASEVIAEHASEQGVSGYIAARGGFVPVMNVTRPTWKSSERNQIVQWNDDIYQFIVDEKIPTVILVAAWLGYIDEGIAETDATETDATGMSRLGAAKALSNKMSATIKKLTNAGVRVFIFKQAPVQDFDVGKAYRNQLMFGWPSSLPVGITVDEYHRMAKPMDSVFDSLSIGPSYILDPSPYCFDDTGHTKLIQNERILYIDSHHLASPGVREFYSIPIDEMIREISTIDVPAE